MQGLRLSWLLLLFLFVSFAQSAGAAGQAAAASVEAEPAKDQVVMQPPGTAFSIRNGSGAASVTFNDPLTFQEQNISPGVVFQEDIKGYKPNIFHYDLWSPKMTCSGPAQDIVGNWSQCNLINYKFTDTQRGIAQRSNGVMASYGIGDRAINYDYATFFGGVQTFSDEGITANVTHAVQNGFLTGPVTDGGSGVPIISANVTCKSAGGESCSYSMGNYFNDGGIVFNQSQGRALKIVATGRELEGFYLDVTGIHLPVSSAWGNIASCTKNANGRFQIYTSVTCKIKLGTAPASPGSFVANRNIFLAGPFEEEAYVTAVTQPAGGVQEVTFNTRYFWHQNVPTIVMQGGPGGEAVVENPAWPIAWYVIGAFSDSRLVYSNCHLGFCNSPTINGVTPRAADTNSFRSYGSVKRVANVVTFSMVSQNAYTAAIYGYPKGSTVVLSGWSPEDLNGTYTVTNNSMDSFSASMQWAQKGPDESSKTTGMISKPLISAAIYPAAFINGTDGGKVGVAQLGKNHVTFGLMPSGTWTPNTSYAVGYTLMDPAGHEQIVKAGGVSGKTAPAWRESAGEAEDNEVVWSYVGKGGPDIVVGAPTSEYEQVGFQYYASQATPLDLYTPSKGITVADFGPSDMLEQYEAANNVANGVAPTMFGIKGAFNKVFSLRYRPAHNGVIIYVGGDEPISANRKPYYLFEDNLMAGSILVRPNEGGFSMFGGLTVEGPFHVNGGGGTTGFYVDALKPGPGPLCLNGKGGEVTNIGCGSGASHTTNVVVQPAPGDKGNAIEVQGHDGKAVAAVDGTGNMAGANGTFSGSVRSGQYIGPATAPSGSCMTNGAWVFSQDGHATFCAGGKWVTKI